MNKKKDMEPANANTTENLKPPFVNEECGDTMWNVVLKESEERLNAIINRRPDGSCSET